MNRQKMVGQQQQSVPEAEALTTLVGVLRSFPNKGMRDRILALAIELASRDDPPPHLLIANTDSAAAD